MYDFSMMFINSHEQELFKEGYLNDIKLKREYYNNMFDNEN